MIYLDNAATTFLDPAVLDEMMPYLTELYGNPSSRHQLGFEAKKAIGIARARVAQAINAEPSQIIFTSGATESNNWLGVNYSVFASNSEHPSIQKNVSSSPSTTDANVLSRMMVNNETGLINDIKTFVKVTQRTYLHTFPPYLVHTDATQAFGHMKIDVQDLGVDFLTLSAHKFHGPKGVGILYIRDRETVKPLLYGGGQELGLRSGTENVAAIVGMGKAAELHNFTESIGKQLNNLKELFISGLYEIYDSIDGLSRDDIVTFKDRQSIVDDRRYVPNIIPVVFKKMQAENIVDALDYNGICASTGSACHNNDTLNYGYSYSEIGIERKDLNSVVRFSTSVYNTADEIRQTLITLNDIIRKQVAFTNE